MINLFNIPNYKINTADFTHYLHSKHVQEFENNFCEYVGAKYACSVNSATNAIFLALLDKNAHLKIPSMIPPVVANAILTICQLVIRTSYSDKYKKVKSANCALLKNLLYFDIFFRMFIQSKNTLCALINTTVWSKK